MGDRRDRLSDRVALLQVEYPRTSEVRFLLKAYMFYKAILSRGYFQDRRAGKGKEEKEEPKVPLQKSDLGILAKELRFVARFVMVALPMDHVEAVRQLLERLHPINEAGFPFQ